MQGGEMEGDMATEPQRATPQRLYREPEDKKLAGVCGGLADYLGVDPSIVRLTAVLVIVAAPGFAGVLAYLIAALVIPERPPTVPRVQATSGVLPAGSGRSNTLLVALIVAALLIIVTGPDWRFDGPVAGLVLVALGIWMLLSRDERRENPPEVATWSGDRTTLMGEAASGSDPSDDLPTTISSSELDDSAGPRGEVPPPVPPWGPTSPYAAVPAPPASPRSSGATSSMVAFCLIAAGILALLAIFDIWDVSFQEGLGAILLIIGVALVVGAWRGHVRGLLALALPALGLLVIADTIDLPLDAGSGTRRIEVTTLRELEELDQTQELLAGELVLDLEDAPLDRPGAPPLDMKVDVGLGNLDVHLPENVTAELDLDVGAGTIQVEESRTSRQREAESPGDVSDDGVDIERSLVLEGEEGGGRIVLDLHVGLGELRVFRG